MWQEQVRGWLPRQVGWAPGPTSQKSPWNAFVHIAVQKNNEKSIKHLGCIREIEACFKLGEVESYNGGWVMGKKAEEAEGPGPRTQGASPLLKTYQEPSTFSYPPSNLAR